MFSIVSSQRSITSLMENSLLWNKIIQNTRKFFLKMDTDFSSNPTDPLFLLSLAGADIEDSSEMIAGIADHPESVLEFPESVFILELSDSQCNSIQKDYGVLCYGTSDNHCPNPHLCLKGWSVDTLSEKKRNWKDLLKNMRVPSNSLIIIDRYLFSSEAGESIQDAYDNLSDILEMVVPRHLKTNFQVFILFDFTSVKPREVDNISRLSEKLNKVRRKLNRDFLIDIELLSMDGNSYKYEETHDRKIISNYFTITATHKIKAFRGEQPLCRQGIFLKYLFSEGLDADDMSDIPEAAHRADLVFMNEVINFASAKWGKQYKYAVNGLEKDRLEVNNRLLAKGHSY